MVCENYQPAPVSLRRSSKPKNVLGGTFLVAFGLRCYSPTLGRWINRDPIGEQGGVNVYGMIENNSPNDWDVLGLYPPPSKPYPYATTIKNLNQKELFKAGAKASLVALDLTNKYDLPKSGLRMTPVFPPRNGRRHYPIYHEYLEPPEFCGRLCCNENTGKIEATKPVCGGFEPRRDDEENPRHITYHPKKCDVSKSPPCPKGSKEVGWYHSHPPGELEFSPGDLRMANRRLVFVATEAGVQVGFPWQVDNYRKGNKWSKVHTIGVAIGNVDPKTGNVQKTDWKPAEKYENKF